MTAPSAACDSAIAAEELKPQQLDDAQLEALAQEALDEAMRTEELQRLRNAKA